MSFSAVTSLSKNFVLDYIMYIFLKKGKKNTKTEKQELQPKEDSMRSLMDEIVPYFPPMQLFAFGTRLKDFECVWFLDRTVVYIWEIIATVSILRALF